MRNFSWMSAVVAAGLLLASGSTIQAQAGGDQPPGQPGQTRGGRGGFGQAGQPVQGIVTAVSVDKLTIKTDAGDSYDVTVTADSRIMENRQPIKLSDVKAGDSVTAMGQVDATKKTVQAMMVNAIDAATVAKAKENMGKTYITGKITAIDADNLKLTVTRTDNVSQVIAVDDGTSFQRGNRGVSADVAAAGGIAMGGFGGRGTGGGRQGAGAQQTPAESITLADIKVGDTLMATGTMKGGTFTALKMGVSEPGMGPGARGGGRRRAPGDTGRSGGGSADASISAAIEGQFRQARKDGRLCQSLRCVVLTREVGRALATDVSSGRAAASCFWGMRIRSVLGECLCGE